MLPIDPISPPLFETLNSRLPRYTSYPPTPHFSFLTEPTYLHHLQKSEGTFSLYIHIPFCKKMCLFCACSVVLNRKEENLNRYLQALFQEIDLLCQSGKKYLISQLHIGGGTPTSFQEHHFEQLFEKLFASFKFLLDCEISIEIDPRTIYQDPEKKLSFFKKLGITRISMGVQDLDAKVQKAIQRNQTFSMTASAIAAGKKLAFEGIHMDLIYGLPYQNLASFTETLDQVIHFSVDRISLFSYAHVPWIKIHQKALPEKALPNASEKLALYLEAKKKFIQAGYVPIGMDHFAKKEEELVKAFKEKTLHRSFQGYSVKKADYSLGLGCSSIGLVQGLYVQNQTKLEDYYQALQKGSLPIFKGHLLQKEDQIRFWVIQQILCFQKVDKRLFKTHFSVSFDSHFCSLKEKLQKMEQQKLIQQEEDQVQATAKGSLFLRHIASLFDAYLQTLEKKYSRGI